MLPDCRDPDRGEPGHERRVAAERDQPRCQLANEGLRRGATLGEHLPDR
jgi:hypothetical protein